MTGPQTNTTASTKESRTIVIVDPIKNRFGGLLRLLEETNFKIEYFPPTEEHLDAKIIEIKPDVILINLFLGGKSSLPLIRDLKVALNRYNSKILVITAHQSINNIRESIKAGADDFIIEPYEPKQLLQRIKYQLQDREFYSPEELAKKADQGGSSGEGFQLVYDCLRSLSEVTDNHQAITSVLEKVAAFSKSQRVNLIEGDLETNEGTVAASSDDKSLQDLKIDLEKYPECREVLINHNIVYIKDVTQNPLTKGIQEQVKSIKINSLIVFPVRHRNATLGSLNIRLSNEEHLARAETHLKTYYMVALSLGPKLAARKLLRKSKTPAPVTPSSASDPSNPQNPESV